MEPAQREKLENEIGACLSAQDFDDAATRLVRGYGPELLSYLMAVLRDDQEASEAFAIFCEEMWKSLPKFRRDSSVRTWSYALIRHAMHRILRSPHRKSERAIPLSQAPAVFQAAEQVRTTTLVFLRTEVKDRMAKLREKLSEEEQTLLILRVNRGMSWLEIGKIMAPEADTELEPPELKKWAAKLRKRFQRAKDQLRELAEQEGLLNP